jgi:hypothetical protein
LFVPVNVIHHFRSRRVDFVRYARVDAQDLQLRRTHECTVNASSSTPAPPAAHS